MLFHRSLSENPPYVAEVTPDFAVDASAPYIAPIAAPPTTALVPPEGMSVATVKTVAARATASTTLDAADTSTDLPTAWTPPDQTPPPASRAAS